MIEGVEIVGREERNTRCLEGAMRGNGVRSSESPKHDRERTRTCLCIVIDYIHAHREHTQRLPSPPVGTSGRMGGREGVKGDGRYSKKIQVLGEHHQSHAAPCV